MEPKNESGGVMEIQKESVLPKKKGYKARNRPDQKQDHKQPGHPG
jgi:hypothetical protein